MLPPLRLRLRLPPLLLLLLVSGATPAPGGYRILGSVDVGNFDSTMIWWKGRPLHQDNVGRRYPDHAGRWLPPFRNHSYARFRDLYTGEILVNISATLGYGFMR